MVMELVSSKALHLYGNFLEMELQRAQRIASQLVETEFVPGLLAILHVKLLQAVHLTVHRLVVMEFVLLPQMEELVQKALPIVLRIALQPVGMVFVPSYRCQLMPKRMQQQVRKIVHLYVGMVCVRV
jgi:hypothetical protein